MSSMVLHHKWFLTATVVGGVVLYYTLNKIMSRKDWRSREEALRWMIDQQLYYGKPNVKLHVISSTKDWEKVEQQFLDEIDSCKLMGLDCEWVNHNDYVGKVALLQLGLPTGLCLLLRTCTLGKLPDSLTQVLKSYDVLKLGVAVAEDGEKLLTDFGVEVNGTVDLRNVVKDLCPEYTSKMGLKSLSKHFLGFSFPTHWQVCCSGWEDATLRSDRIEYACNDAIVAANIALVIALLWSTKNSLSSMPCDLENLTSLARNLCQPFSGKKFKTKLDHTNEASKPSKPPKEKNDNVKARSKYCIRKTPLYHNAYLIAPDGQPLCVCDNKKANWYVEKGLGFPICQEPLMIKLTFEPSGRPEGQAGEYYLTPKENLCVVCGAQDSYLRKYIVPHEYRKYFPDVMRDHQSHDVLLMCTKCHQRSNLLDNSLRRELADQCNAPIGVEDDLKYFDVSELKSVRSAGRALLKDRNKGQLPKERKEELLQIIKDYFKVEDLSGEHFEEAANKQLVVLNERYSPHAKKVVEHFIKNDGIIQLEKTWRQHFLDTMEPKFLPPLWSVDHQQQRLEIRAAENRIDPEDYQKANGLAN